MRPARFLTLSLAVFVLVMARQAGAQVTCQTCTGGLPCPSPATCTQSRGFADIGTVASTPFVVSGQPICYQVSYGNNPSNLPDACDVTGATVVLVCPNANGLADQTGGTSQIITLASNTAFPANGSANVINQGSAGDLCCNPVTFNQGVTTAQAAIFGGSATSCDLGEVHLSIPQSFSVTKSAATPVLTCAVQVDKEISCDGGATFHDVGFVSADTDSSDFCLGWNAHDNIPAESIIVRYAVKNTSSSGLVLHNCTIAERNTQITSSAVSIGDVATQSTPVAVTNPCSTALSANEPDRGTVTCDCTSTAGQVQVTAFDEAKFVCQTPGLTVVKTCPATTPVLCGTSTSAGFTITAHNSGTADLANCSVTDTVFPGDTTCTTGGTSVTVTPASIASLPAGGQDATSTGSVTLSADSCNKATVTCNIVGSAGPKSVTASDNTTCQIPCFTTTTSTTTSTTTTTVPPAGGCRVTGGGIVDACGPDLAGGDAPTHCGNRQFDALDATHGGQVGAPVGVATAFTPDSACIRGEWTHVRHIRPSLVGNFHARTFDSLNCACLPCAGDPGSGQVTDGLCNPGDKICGPEPRRAPDNAICFSGVGDYTETNGKRDGRSVVFRVDIQDHSEPGGTNGTEPPDRYRLRLWFLNGADPKDSQIIALRTAVGCAHAGVEDVTAATPDIDDGGDLLRGNHQIHPPLPGTDRCTP